MIRVMSRLVWTNCNSQQDTDVVFDGPMERFGLKRLLRMALDFNEWTHVVNSVQGISAQMVSSTFL